jgi:hypothetical protein
MGPLRNPRHEAFARALFENKSADESYVIAGYSENRGNATRLKAKESIQLRVAELQAEAQRKSEVTVESLLSELEEARQKASNLDQLSAAVRAIEAKARVSGLLVQRIEQTIDVNIAAYEAAGSVDESALLFAKHFADDTVLSNAELSQLAEMTKEACQRMSDFVKACRVKPVIAGHSQRQIEQHRLTNWKAR